ncbi:MAG: phosphoglycerate kinase, partial [Candidatus Colwellbacteria bacterium]|nr:phosphoglycerate kinase [Candidatus Colwellbacteria bacterium]
MRNLRGITDLKDKKVLLRVDFDVPVSDKGQIEESFRIKKQKEALDYLVNQGAKIVMVAHISDQSVGQSFAALMPQLHMLLGYEVNFLKTVSEIGPYLENYAPSTSSGQAVPALLDNVRQNDGEKKNDPEFAKQLAAGFDLYVNNDFAVCHREHASVSAITGFLPSYAGLLISEEIAQLKKAVDAPKEGKVILIGGAKADTKVPVVKNFIDKAELIPLGGVVANDILKERGMDIGASIADENSKELLAGLDLNSPVLLLPKDFVISENK